MVPAAGSGDRLGEGRPKALVDIGGRAILSWALDALAAGGVDAAVVAGPPDAAQARQLADVLAADPPSLPVTVVAGGPDRTTSVAAGLSAVPVQAEVVLVHDAARPLVPPAVVARVVAAVRAGAPGAVPALPVVDTVKHVLDGFVHATVDRGNLVSVQTPQGFDPAVLRRAFAGSPAVATDDASLVEAMGVAVRVVVGDPAAFKITRPLDLVLAEALLARRAR